MVSGFISFPILTRIFSVGDYGILGLVTTTIFIATAIGKFGLVGSIVRFYAEYKADQRLGTFYTTMFIGSVGCAATIAILFYVVSQFFQGKVFDEKTVGLIPMICAIVFITCTIDTLTTFLRAEQKTKLYNFVAIVRRYGSLFLGIFFILFVVKGLYGFYLGYALWGAVVLSFLIYISARGKRVSDLAFSSKLLGTSIKFGFPLIWAELGYLVLNYADRYLVQIYLGSISLGIYVAGYNLATYVTEIIMYPVNYAMGPIFMDILVNRGEEKTREFFTKTFRYFLLIMFPIVFGFIAVEEDLLRILATSKYLEACPVMPYVVIGQSIYACSLLLNNGLFIKNKTYILTYVIFAACLVNIGLNMVLIPRFGIVGAAQATLLSNLFYTVMITYYAFKEFSFQIDYGHIFRYLGAATIMYLTVKMIHLDNQLVNLVSEIAAGAVVYSSLVLVFDREIRENLLKFASTLKKGYKKHSI
jgi:O-antigen/teichoic acid export membrane protein